MPSKPSVKTRRAKYEIEKGLVKDRDRSCVLCGCPKYFNVAHVTSYRAFRDGKTANRTDNLVLLCVTCHLSPTMKQERDALFADIRALRLWTYEDDIRFDLHGYDKLPSISIVPAIEKHRKNTWTSPFVLHPSLPGALR